ncbi:nuclear envelope pore membrane protein POM 121 [Periophthalmus magnuspinnatus]|uniref:nuclear envelope pore membrane protein POM 121 n=1 Tax=Periophthalmus magnuspinnatus TaxID=409849 RepID=UPI0024372837|nr:nuclear envelope pore membrane protein POM 121 [Periophthalmus magnuspinnatus]
MKCCSAGAQAAMSPARRRHLALFSVLGILTIALYYWPILLYFSVILAFLFIVLYYRSPEALLARLGLNPPRTRGNIQSVLRRWLWAWRVSGVSVPPRRLEKFISGKTKLPSREQAQPYDHRFVPAGPYRQEALNSESFLFSPRDLLMGSYIAKAESPPPENSLRARASRNPREQLRLGLAKPNYAVYTPKRRLSFTGEPLGSGARFTITPQRHYPLQQQGASPLGILPPLRWDGFKQKSVLRPRNSSVSSPVTVKIARPDGASHGLEHVSSLVFPSGTVDPCSRESVLKVLKESRKREVEEEGSSFTAQQKSKRRRNDSGGSAQSAFEPLLPNGMSSQLIPKPGSLKRGLTVTSEEPSLKHSRTSSVSSSSGGPLFRGTPYRGTPSSNRNPISSSYSSSRGMGQRKRPLAVSPLSSTGPSRSQTPEGSSKKTREEEQECPSTESSVKSDRASGQLPVLDASSSPPTEPCTSSTKHTGSGGKQRRKIQLMARDPSLSLPPPPELGYTVTVKDLDEEKRSTLNKICKILEMPAPEPASSSAPSTAGSSVTLSTSVVTVSGILGASVGTAGSVLGASVSAAGCDLGASVGVAGGSTVSIVSSVDSAPSQTNILLESLKRKSPAPASVTVSAQVQPTVALQTSVPSVSTSVIPTTTAPCQQSSALAPAPAPAPAPGLFSLLSTAPPSSTSAATVTPSLLTSGFKPIFNTSSSSSSSTSNSTAADTKPLQNFKPIFGTAPESSVPAPASSLVSASTNSVFSGSSSNTTASLFSTSAAPVSGGLAVTPMFGSSSGSTLQVASTPGTNPSSSSQTGMSLVQTAPTQTSSIGATFGGFGTTSTPAPHTFGISTTQAPPPYGTTSTQAPPTFGSTASTQAPPTFGSTASTQAPPTFGSTASTQAPPTFGSTASTQVPSTFGATASTQAPPTFGSTPSTKSNTFGTTMSQSTFTFGKSSLESSATQPSFSSTAEPPKAFTFGAASSAPTTQTAPPALGQTPSTVPSFGTLPKPSFSFGSSTAAAPAFGTETPQSSSAFTFGSSAQQPAPSNTQPSAVFKFGAASPPQFGTPVNNIAPQMGAFTFGATNSDKPAFGSPASVFGQPSAPAPIPFGSPGTLGQSFSAGPFGSPVTPSFSIGAGSKPSATRQRLQARRPHNRKK